MAGPAVSHALLCVCQCYRHDHLKAVLQCEHKHLLLNRCEDVCLAVRVEGNALPEQVYSYISLSRSGPEPREEPDSSSVQEEVCGSELEVLKVQLRRAEETAHQVQREVPAALVTGV